MIIRDRLDIVESVLGRVSSRLIEWRMLPESFEESVDGSNLDIRIYAMESLCTLLSIALDDVRFISQN